MEPCEEDQARLESRGGLTVIAFPSSFRNGKTLDVYVNVGMMAEI